MGGLPLDGWRYILMLVLFTSILRLRVAGCLNLKCHAVVRVVVGRRLAFVYFIILLFELVSKSNSFLAHVPRQTQHDHDE